MINGGFAPKVVILCGGQGTRLREETEFKPKPLVNVGEHPILWHIMKIYSHFGYRDFILCLGYKGTMIKEYFLDYVPRKFNFTINTKTKEIKLHDDSPEDWNVTLVDTGEETKTAERILKIKKFVEKDPFFLATYGDGVADVNINKLIDYHISHGKIATLTGFSPVSRYGLIKMTEDMKVTQFQEKPVLKGDIINAGFFAFNQGIFEFLRESEMLEESLPRVAGGGELVAYHHQGFFHPMDTHRDYLTLNEMWKTGQAPWKIWSD